MRGDRQAVVRQTELIGMNLCTSKAAPLLPHLFHFLTDPIKQNSELTGLQSPVGCCKGVDAYKALLSCGPFWGVCVGGLLKQYSVCKDLAGGDLKE